MASPDRALDTAVAAFVHITDGRIAEGGQTESIFWICGEPSGVPIEMMATARHRC